MNSEKFVPPRPSNSQPENLSPSAGHEWNNGITRRSFLKRTGGATLATMVTWHGLNTQLNAADPSDGNSGITVSIPDINLGIDNYGYRFESQKLTTKYEWLYMTPNQPMTLPHDPSEAEGQPPPNQYTIPVQLSDKNANVSFRVVGDEPGCIMLWGVTNEGNGTMKFKIRALAPSTPITTINGYERRPNGTVIEAVHKGKVVGRGKVYVLQPKYLDKGAKGTVIKDVLQMAAQKPGRTYFAEYEGQPVDVGLSQHHAPPNTTPHQKSYIQTIEVKVQDQYKKPLDALYAGTGVEEDGTWIAWCKSGTYEDPVGPAGSDVIFPTEERITEFGVSVAGHEVGLIRRKFSISNDDGSKADYKLVWD